MIGMRWRDPWWHRAGWGVAAAARVATWGVVFAATAALLAGCGPLYTTEYRFTPPESDQARLCVAQCLQTREFCRANEDQRAALRASECRSEANLRYANCLALAANDEARARCRPSVGGCSAYANVDRCEADYRVCYQTCGGQVEALQVCTFNCPSVPSTTTPTSTPK